MVQYKTNRLPLQSEIDRYIVIVPRSTYVYLHREDKTKLYVEARGAYQPLCCTALMDPDSNCSFFEESYTLCISDRSVHSKCHL